MRDRDGERKRKRLWEGLIRLPRPLIEVETQIILRVIGLCLELWVLLSMIKMSEVCVRESLFVWGVCIPVFRAQDEYSIAWRDKTKDKNGPKCSYCCWEVRIDGKNLSVLSFSYFFYFPSHVKQSLTNLVCQKWNFFKPTWVLFYMQNTNTLTYDVIHQKSWV